MSALGVRHCSTYTLLAPTKESAQHPGLRVKSIYGRARHICELTVRPLGRHVPRTGKQTLDARLKGTFPCLLPQSDRPEPFNRLADYCFPCS